MENETKSPQKPRNGSGHIWPYLAHIKKIRYSFLTSDPHP